MAFPTLNTELFNCLVPEFKNSDCLEVIAAAVANCFNESVWGDKIEMGHIYLVAHTLKMAERNGTGGTITSEKVGDLARSYSAGKDDDEYDQTSYGKEYKRLLTMLLTSPFIASC